MTDYYEVSPSCSYSLRPVLTVKGDLQHTFFAKIDFTLGGSPLDAAILDDSAMKKHGESM